MINDLISASGLNIWMFIKWLYVALFGLYLIFTLLMWRQIMLMSHTLNGAIQIPTKMVGMVLVMMAGVALVAAVVIL